MASWKDMFGGGKKRGKREEAATPDDVPYVPPAFAFDGVIKQHAWIRSETNHAGGENHVHEHVFLNPDPESPIAALMVSVVDELPVLALEAIPRDRSEVKAAELLEAHGLTQDKTPYDMSDQTIDRLNGKSIGDFSPHIITLLGEAAYSNPTKNQMMVNGRLALEKLDHTEALSKHPQVRDAMVEALCQHFVTFNVAKDFGRNGHGKQ